MIDLNYFAKYYSRLTILCIKVYLNRRIIPKFTGLFLISCPRGERKQKSQRSRREKREKKKGRKGKKGEKEQKRVGRGKVKRIGKGQREEKGE